MTKQSILFDLGNVVVDWDINRLIQNLELSESKKSLVKKELFNNHYWTDLDQGIITEEEVTQRIAEKSDLTIPELEYCFLAAKQSLIDIPETITLMEELHSAGIKMYCLSNMSIETYRFIEKHKFFNYFQDIVISGFIKVIKPHSEIFQHMLDKFALKPEEITFIDDSYVNIKTAEKFGINTIHFKRTADSYQQVRDAIKSS
ncbi:MAG: HAD family phosphatase [Kiritimatiellae bacterium]|nr:HAD family phosphatase [Kiritimatiellia bacterium]